MFLSDKKTRAKETAFMLCAYFAAAVESDTYEKIDAFFISRSRLYSVINNLMAHTYADSIFLSEAVHAQAEDNMKKMSFWRAVVAINADEIETYEDQDPKDRSAPMFLNAAKDILQKFDALSDRLQYVVVNLFPTQDDIETLFSTTKIVALTALPDDQFEREIGSL